MRIWVKRSWVLLKVLMALGICVGIGLHFSRILNRPEFAHQEWSFHAWPLVASGLCYGLAHTIWGLFWWRLLRHQDVAISPGFALRAYFISQAGKYIPGKVWVLLIRVGMLGNVPKSTVAITAAYETLTTMAAGAIFAVCMAGLTGLGVPTLQNNLPILAGIAALPLGIWAFLKLAGRIARRAQGPDARPFPNPSLGLLLTGLLQASLGWCLLGLSLGLAVSAVVPDPPGITLSGWMHWSACIALAYVIGFVVLVSPGGLGPREYLLAVLLPVQAGSLTPGLDEASVVLIALALRMVWTIVEATIAAVCYLVPWFATWVPTQKEYCAHAE